MKRISSASQGNTFCALLIVAVELPREAFPKRDSPEQLAADREVAGGAAHKTDAGAFMYLLTQFSEFIASAANTILKDQQPTEETMIAGQKSFTVSQPESA